MDFGNAERSVMPNMESLSPFWPWLALAGMLLIVELMLMPTGFLLIAAGAAACVAAVTFLVPVPVLWQWAVFAALTLAATLIWRRFIHKPEKKEAGQAHINLRAAQMLGYNAVLTEDLVNGRGRISVNDASWPVLAPDSYPAGTKVEVVEVRGITLLVRATADSGKS